MFPRHRIPSRRSFRSGTDPGAAPLIIWPSRTGARDRHASRPSPSRLGSFAQGPAFDGACKIPQLVESQRFIVEDSPQAIGFVRPFFARREIESPSKALGSRLRRSTPPASRPRTGFQRVDPRGPAAIARRIGFVWLRPSSSKTHRVSSQRVAKQGLTAQSAPRANRVRSAIFSRKIQSLSSSTLIPIGTVGGSSGRCPTRSAHKIPLISNATFSAMPSKKLGNSPRGLFARALHPRNRRGWARPICAGSPLSARPRALRG